MVRGRCSQWTMPSDSLSAQLRPKQIGVLVLSAASSCEGQWRIESRRASGNESVRIARSMNFSVKRQASSAQIRSGAGRDGSPAAVFMRPADRTWQTLKHTQLRDMVPFGRRDFLKRTLVPLFGSLSLSWRLTGICDPGSVGWWGLQLQPVRGCWRGIVQPLQLLIWAAFRR